MNALTLWNQTQVMVSHAYFERKEKFEMDEDCYAVWVLFAVEAGKFRFRIGEERGEAGAGDLVYCPPGVVFQREMVSPLELHYIGFEFAGREQTELIPLLPSSLARPLDGKRLASDFAYLRKLHFAADSRNALRKQMILNDIWQLACEVWEGEHPQDEMLRLEDSDDELMNRAADWLYKHAYTPFGMSTLSGSLGLSPVQFTRRFRKSFRLTPSDFVRSLRIRKVAELLLDTDLTLDQIAARCGYENGFYLSRVFSKSMGASPSKYREKNRV
ncbi:helix-turn-helix domain-containing protein [Cohnella zeiphila]|uniref:Helix-turn-helix transcriptional regulator n=1 Tax=Cohnella zeiphila TaxID=2761120 RepID=A0A7X0VWT7_9BACL|nr:AraC family transcriptional regulator [Cohnella zeiphila]MBB6733326.1 helix-turn-helix transcriptional regulator [Cohnella zeiphila]